MPAVLMLKDRKTDKLYLGRDLIEVDERMCRVLGVSPDPVDFYRHWLDRHGFRLALGQSFDDLRKAFPDEKDIEITDYLDGSFTNGSFHER